jgi:hypothetical protein
MTALVLRHRAAAGHKVLTGPHQRVTSIANEVHDWIGCENLMPIEGRAHGTLLVCCLAVSTLGTLFEQSCATAEAENWSPADLK